MHREAFLVGEDGLLEEVVGERGEHDSEREGDHEAGELILRSEGRVHEMFAEDVDLLPNKMFKRMLEHSQPEEFHSLASDLVNMTTPALEAP